MTVCEAEASNVTAVTIDFVGEITIRDVAEAHASLAETVASSPSVVANVAPDAVVDLTFVQLLESARRTAREAQMGFRLSRPADGSLLETLQRGGFLATPGDREFWLMHAEVR
jgi:hypothetical protein